MKIEVVITVWNDGLFISRDKFEGSAPKELYEQYREIIAKIKMAEIERETKKNIIDDDIPF